MAKQNKTPKSPRKEAPQTETPKNTPVVEVVDVHKVIEGARRPNQSGLDANHRVDLAVLNHKIFGEDADAAAKYGENVVNTMNHVTAIMAISETVTEAVVGQSTFALTVRRSYLTELSEVAATMDITLDQKMLPAPEKDADGEEVVTVPAAAFVPSKEVKEAIKKEEEVRATGPKYSPLEIKNDDELREALNYILNESMSPFQNMTNAVNFYSSYLKVQASKDKKDDDKPEQSVPTFAEMLETVLSLVDTIPLCTQKIADNMCTTTGAAKSVIPAFCTMRDATKNRKTGIPAIDDSTIAAIVKILVKYAANKRIKEYNKNLEVLNTDKEKNAAAIESSNNSIAYLNNIIATVDNPSAESISNMIAQYENKQDINHSIASRSFNQIVRTYYGSVDSKTIKQDVLKHNVEQYAGIITNLFRDPLSQIVGYNESNILELVAIPTSEEKKS